MNNTTTTTPTTMKTILLTGASGYLGQHVLASLLQQTHHDVQHIYAWTSTRKTQQALQQALPMDAPVTVEAMDLTHEDSVRAWFRGKHDKDNDSDTTTTNNSNSNNKRCIDVCIHTAALSIPRQCEEAPERATAVNVPRVFLECLHDCQGTTTLHATRCIVLSTDQVYDGEHAPYRDDDDDDDDDTKYVPQPVNHYGRTKVALEHAVLELLRSRAVVLRSSLLVGPRAPYIAAHDTFFHFIASRMGQSTTYYTNERRSVLAVRDAVATIQYFVHQQNDWTVDSCVFNMGGPESVSRFDMAQAVCAYLQGDASCLVPVEKEEASDTSVRSPLDISMDSSRLYQHTQLSFARLEEMVRLTLENS
jgi:dTDP-4-dehydrorhamnose reductase